MDEVDDESPISKRNTRIGDRLRFLRPSTQTRRDPRFDRTTVPFVRFFDSATALNFILVAVRDSPGVLNRHKNDFSIVPPAQGRGLGNLQGDRK